MPQNNQNPWSGRHNEKDKLRSRIWSTLLDGAATEKDPTGHIPQFHGSDHAAHRLSQLSIWKQAKVIKCNPDKAQLPVRLQAIQDGKLLYMAVPRLTEIRCFIEFDPNNLPKGPLENILSAQQAVKSGRLVRFEEMQPIDLVVTGCVAVTRFGGRTGKGAGFADLELGMLREYGLVTPDTPVVTTVHKIQIVDHEELPMQAHDTPLDWIVTPGEVIRTNTQFPKPGGIDWAMVLPEQFETIPALKFLHDREESRKKG